jgi:bacterioferritin (cytochrome b1)
LTFETMIQTALDSRLHAMSRRNLFRTAAIAGGSVAAIGTIGFAAAQDGTPTDQMTDDAAPFETAVDVLNYALTLEHLEAAFYRDGLAEFGVDAFTSWGYDASVYDKLTAIAAHEADHVTTLTSVITDLGGEPVAESTYDFGYADAQEFLAVAQALEDTGVSAYQGAAQYAMADDALLTAALHRRSQWWQPIPRSLQSDPDPGRSADNRDPIHRGLNPPTPPTSFPTPTKWATSMMMSPTRLFAVDCEGP